MSLEVGEVLREEAATLHAFLVTLDEGDWRAITLFKDWTPWDVVAHLHYFDEVSLTALNDVARFETHRKEFFAALAEGLSLVDQARRALGSYDAPVLLARWKQACDDLATQLAASDPKRRLPWFGPDMGVQMFTTARYMETWAHAQAIYDLKGAPRSHGDQIRNIVAIGVKTYGWTFVNRKLEIPGPPPFVRLTAPSGEVWEYNDPSETERVEGDALDFCLTVTQVRNVVDTQLRVVGDIATRWMSIAQCFAGEVVDPPAPGLRRGA